MISQPDVHRIGLVFLLRNRLRMHNRVKPRHIEFYRVILVDTGAPHIKEKIQHYIEKWLRRELPDSFLSGDDLGTLYLRYVASGAVGVILWWLERDFPHSSAAMSALCFCLSLADLGAVMAYIKPN